MRWFEALGTTGLLRFVTCRVFSSFSLVSSGVDHKDNLQKRIIHSQQNSVLIGDKLDSFQEILLRVVIKETSAQR